MIFLWNCATLISWVAISHLTRWVSIWNSKICQCLAKWYAEASFKKSILHIKYQLDSLKHARKLCINFIRIFHFIKIILNTWLTKCKRILKVRFHILVNCKTTIKRLFKPSTHNERLPFCLKIRRTNWNKCLMKDSSMTKITLLSDNRLI
jgi:hypothetical protein